MQPINQASFTIEPITIAALLRMPETLNGEQAPLKESRVASLTDDLLINPLLDPLSVAELNGRRILVSGRHRVQALSTVYEDDHSRYVACLVYPCETTEEVQGLVLAKNGSRSMNSAEKTELRLAARFGFDDMSRDDLTAIATDVDRDIRERQECMVLAMALDFTTREQHPLAKNTALKLAETLLTEAKRWTEGKGKSKVRLIDTWMSDADTTERLMLGLVDICDYYQLRGTSISEEQYTTLLINTPGIVDEHATSHTYGTKFTTLKYPPNLQRVVAKYVKALPLRRDMGSYIQD